MNEPDPFTVKSFYWTAFNEYVDAIEELTTMFECGKSPDPEALAECVKHMSRKRTKLSTLVRIAKHKYKMELEPGLLGFNTLGGIC